MTEHASAKPGSVIVSETVRMQVMKTLVVSFQWSRCLVVQSSQVYFIKCFATIDKIFTPYCSFTSLKTKWKIEKVLFTLIGRTSVCFKNIESFRNKHLETCPVTF